MANQMIWLLPLALAWFLGFLLLWRFPLCRMPVSGVAGASPPSVSIVIPARNEAHNLPRLLGSLRNQSRSPPADVIVVDDHSTDATASVARDGGARVHMADRLPEGWRGKPWACQQGAAAARGAILVFVDADTWFVGDALARLVAVFEQQRLDALSLLPYHVTQRVYEQGSAMFNLVTAMGLGCFAVFGSPWRPTGLAGPLLMIRRTTYETVNGHAAVRAAILENLHLGRRLRDRGFTTACLGGKHSLHTRMYPDGFRQLVEGWIKAFAGGAAATPALVMALIVTWISGAMATFALTLAAAAGLIPVAAWIPVAYACYALQTGWMFRRLGRFAVGSALLYPVHMLFFFVLFGISSYRRLRHQPVTWRGREMPSG